MSIQNNSIAVRYSIFQTGVLDFNDQAQEFHEYIGFQPKNVLDDADQHPEPWALIRLWRVRWLYEGQDISIGLSVVPFSRLFRNPFSLDLRL